MPLSFVKDLKESKVKGEVTGKYAGMKLSWSDYEDISKQLGLPVGVTGASILDTLVTKLDEKGVKVGFLCDEVVEPGEVVAKDEKYVGKKYDLEPFSKACQILGLSADAGGSAMFKMLLVKAVETGIIVITDDPVVE